MKKASLMAAGVFVLSTIASIANATQFKAQNESTVTQLCMTALNGNKLAMHNKIKETGFSKKFVANNVKCNGKALLAYIEKRGINADEMIKMLARKGVQVSISDVAKLSPNLGRL